MGGNAERVIEATKNLHPLGGISKLPKDAAHKLATYTIDQIRSGNLIFYPGQDREQGILIQVGDPSLQNLPDNRPVRRKSELHTFLSACRDEAEIPPYPRNITVDAKFKTG